MNNFMEEEIKKRIQEINDILETPDFDYDNYESRKRLNIELKQLEKTLTDLDSTLQSNTLGTTMEERLIEAIKKADICYGWDKYDETDYTYEKPRLIHENDMLMSEIIEAILPVLSQARQETIKECVEKIKGVQVMDILKIDYPKKHIHKEYPLISKNEVINLLSKDIEQ